MRSKLFLLILFSLVTLGPAMLSAQQMLELQEAVQIGMEKNYAIQIARNESQIAENNASLGNAGFLPRIQATANQNGSMTSSRQEYFNGAINDNNNALASSINSGLTAQWTVFDGFRMFATREKLSRLSRIGELDARSAVEETVSSIMDSYYEIVRQQQRLQVRRDALEISRERLQIARSKLEVGSGSGLEVMQARADLNADSSALKQQEVMVANAKTRLNEILARELDVEFTVADTIPLDSLPAIDQLARKMEEQNSRLQAARQNREVADLNLHQIRGERYPELNLNLGYDFSRSQSESGFLKSNRSSGYNVGISASFNLFNGFETNRRAENARIRAKNSRYQYLERFQEMKSRLKQTYRQYRNSMELVALETENVEVAYRTVEIAREKYELGTITPLELKEAQKSFIEAENRLVDAKYQAKRAETEIRQISGQLVTIAE